MTVEEILALWIMMCSFLGIALFIDGVKSRNKKK